MATRSTSKAKTGRLPTKKWDSARHLKTEADIVAYLNACLEEGGDDPAFLAHALGVVARARNVSQIARESGLTRSGLYQMFSGESSPSFETVTRVARALGLRMTFTT